MEQYPVNQDIVRKQAALLTQKAPPTKDTQPAIVIPEATPTPSATSVQQPKGENKSKGEKSGKKGGGGGGDTTAAATSSVPVDVSRLNMRVGQIVKAWKHPDADGLYVEEGRGGN